MMKALLAATGVIETATGITLLAVPAWLVSILLGAPLDTCTGPVLARLAGTALVSLGIACWMGSRDAQSRAAVGIVVAMLVYNLAAVVLLLSVRFGAGMNGMGLLPVAALHAALAAWCVGCLRTAGTK
jgi:thiol:disulfide interchange protein